MDKLSWKRKVKITALPGMLGIGFIYLLPGMAILFYMLIDNVFQKKFVGIANMRETVQNPYFQLALQNTIEMLAVCIICVIGVAFILSIPSIFSDKRFLILGLVLLLPFFMPTVLSAQLWRNFREILSARQLLLGLFAWRNTGVVLLLLEAGLLSANQDMLDAAKVDGANKRQMLLYMYLPSLVPHIAVCVVYLIMQFFGVFREAFLLFKTSYPPDEVYLLQNYMYNHFQKLNYPLLSATVFLFTFILAIAMFFIVKTKQKIAKDKG